MADVRHALEDLEIAAAAPLVVPCARQIIGIDGPQPLSLEVLRGVDRDLADTLVDVGFDVVVRGRLAAREVDEEPVPPPEMWDPTVQNLYFARMRGRRSPTTIFATCSTR